MKDLVQIWNKISNRRYSNVNTSDRELKDLAQNRLRVDKTAFEANFAECEGLNNKFNDDIDFNERKDEIINRLFERRKKGRSRLFVLLMLGFASVGLGFFVMYGHPYDRIFEWKSILSDGGEIFEIWRKPQIELYTRIFLFNVTNSEEYMSGKHDKIKLQEIGPYVYKESLEHDVTAFNDNATLSAIPRHPLTWVEELSEGNKEDDLVILPHIALLSIANVVSEKGLFVRLGLNNLIRMTNSKPLATMTAREFMMGYESRLMTLGATFLPGWISFDKLGLIDRMYDFDGDYETIFTGEDDVRNAGLIDTYRGSTDLPQWDGKHCSNVQYASDGTKFKGGVTKDESILFFRKSLCRAAPLIPTGSGVRNNINALKYTFPEHMMDNGKHIKENKCFCRKGKCLPDGLIDVTDCYYGFPIALSYPHFYQGDEVLFSKVEGLNPNKEEHETSFWIEPSSGLPLDISSKFQINMALGDISMIENSARFSNMYLPLLWFDIRLYGLTPSLERTFRFYLNILPVAEQTLMYISFIAGAMLIMVTIYILTFKIMFKSIDKKQNYNNWSEKGKKCKDGVYIPCEIPLNETDTENSDSQLNEDSRPKAFGDKIKSYSSKITGKVFDTVDSVKGRVCDEIGNVKNIFNDRRHSVKTEEANTGYRSDSGDEDVGSAYKAVKQIDSDDECKYLEVLDDGSEFDEPQEPHKLTTTTRPAALKGYDAKQYIIHVSD